VKILISGVGGDVAQSVLQILKSAHPNYEFHGCDQSDHHGGSVFLSKFFLSPTSENPNFFDWTADLIRKEKYDLYIPIPEPELRVIAANPMNKILEVAGDLGTKVIWAGEKIVNQFADKFTTFLFLESIGVGVAKTWLPEVDLSMLPLPLIVKPSRSSGSRSIFMCLTLAEVSAALLLTENPVIQEYIPSTDSEFTCIIYKFDQNECRILIFHRYLSGGTTSWARVESEPRILEECKRLATALELNGSINVQLRVSNERVAIFEVNPRFSSTVLMRHLIGFTDVLWSTGSPVNLTQQEVELLAGQTIARQISSRVL